MGFRRYANSEVTESLRSRIESTKRELVIADDQLKIWINSCAAGTALFAASSLYWSFYAALDQTCLGSWLSLAVTLVHFAPLPVAVAILYLRSHAVYSQIATKVAAIKRDALS